MLSFIIVSSFRPHALRNLISSLKKDTKFNLSSIFIVNDTPFKETLLNSYYQKVYDKFGIKSNRILNFDGKGPNYGRNEMIEYVKINFTQYTDFLLLDDDLEIPKDENNWVNRFYTQYKILGVDILSCIWNCEKEGAKRMHCSLLIPDELKEIHRYNIQVDRLSICHIPLASFISSFSVFSKIQFSKDIKFYGDFLDLGYQILENKIVCVCNPHFYLHHRNFPNRRTEEDIMRFNPIEFNQLLLDITVKKYRYRNLITHKDKYEYNLPKQFGFNKPKHFSDSWFIIERLIYEYISFYYKDKIGFFNSFCEFNHLYNPKTKIDLPKHTFYISHLPISHSERFPKFNLNQLLQEERFVKNIDKIETIMCLSPIVKNYFDAYLPNKKIILNKHPIIPFHKPISFNIEKFEKEKENKKLIYSGFFYRDEKPFLNCNADGYKKVWYIGRDKETLENKFPELNISELENKIDVKYFVENPEELMSCLENSIFMIYLQDATANNTILDCIQAQTPILVNRCEITEYYLGKNYPFFYKDSKEIEEKLQNINLIKSANLYLKNMKLNQFSIKSMFKKIDMIYDNNNNFYKKYKVGFNKKNMNNNDNQTMNS